MSSGFLDIGELDTVKQSDKSGCFSCKMNYDCESPSIKSLDLRKDGKKFILIIIENPSLKDDDSGKLLSGESGRWFKKQLLSIIPEEYVIRVTAAIRCHGVYKDKNIDDCSIKLKEELFSYSPDLVICSGKDAVKSIIKDKITGRLSGIEYSSYFHEQIPFGKYFVCPTFSHRIVFQKKDKDINYEKLLLNDIKNAVSTIDKDSSIKEVPIEKIKLLTEIPDIKKAIQEKINTESVCAFDYETTGLKPHSKNHKLKIMSITNYKDIISFPVYNEVLDDVKIFLQSERRKIAHNLQFEDMWSYYKVNTDVNNWYWDTMLSAHALHNQKPVGQKYLVFCKFGVIYDDKISKYLQASPDNVAKYGANAVNNIEAAPLDDLLYYCALDSYYCLQLYRNQKDQFEKIDQKYEAGRTLLTEGSMAIAKIQRNGMHINLSAIEKQKKILTKRIDFYYKKIMESNELKKWKEKDIFNPDSNPQLEKLLYTILRYKKPKDVPVTDEQALLLFNNDICTNIIAYRKSKKLRDTYIAQFEREEYNSFIYPFFNLHTVQTFRSSSRDPNFQNLPKRDKEALKRIRSLIIPRKGHRLAEYDYKALEVSIAGCVFKDPNWLKYCRDNTKDMHRDTAQEILYFSPKEWEEYDSAIVKSCRQSAKNGYVFPSIYGSTGKAAAAGMWKQLPVIVKERLFKKKRIKNLVDFTNRMIEYESDYWGKRYPIYGKKRKLFYKKYQRYGYIDQLSGFRCQAPMRYTQIVNYPVQGPASHIKLRALITINQWLLDNNMNTVLLGEIHDALVFDMDPKEEKQIDEIVKYYGTKEVTEYFDWVIVPLTLEKEVGEIDGDWTTMKEDKNF